MYKSPLWQKKRLEILERDDYQCQGCGDKESQLQVHHGYYEKGLKLWEYDNDTLWTYCESCHKQAHDIKIEIYKKTARIEMVLAHDWYLNYFDLLTKISWKIFSVLLSKACGNKLDAKEKRVLRLYHDCGGKHG
jgi:hypothetical protein